MDLTLQITILIISAIVSIAFILLGTFLNLRDKESPVGFIFGVGGFIIMVFSIVAVSGWRPH